MVYTLYSLASIATILIYFWAHQTVVTFDEIIKDSCYGYVPKGLGNTPAAVFAEWGIRESVGYLIAILIFVLGAVAASVILLVSNPVQPFRAFWDRPLDWLLWSGPLGAKLTAFFSESLARFLRWLPGGGQTDIVIFCLGIPACFQLLIQWLSSWKRSYQWGHLYWGYRYGYRASYLKFYFKIILPSVIPVLISAWLAQGELLARALPLDPGHRTWLLTMGARENVLSLAASLIFGGLIFIQIWAAGRGHHLLDEQHRHFYHDDCHVDSTVAQMATTLAVLLLHLIILDWNRLAALVMLGFNLAAASQTPLVPLRFWLYQQRSTPGSRITPQPSRKK
jgi:hypothetical protein